ncbi:MAG: energy-coupling factor ABC transporter permease [Nitrososphaerota archaeon]|nr:energy-coupling factor ABC transporter permease [Nitrososphaerales archaeon]MCX8191973.1 energy-coupling factor ABC transporter permease [Nitrososphaerales archaeon]MDW8045321.1 energy-coupling factor ABC transporter permease [Nitrososphaerota archaeon]
MHIPDGFLDLHICAITYLATIVFWVFAFRRARQVIDEKHIPLMATLTAMFFAAQMMNYPIIGGTTAHILGGPILAITLGPYAGLISMSIILLIQTFLFGDGGITTLGANVWNMGIVGVFIPYMVCLLILKIKSSKTALFIGVFLAALVGDVLAAIFAGLELGLSTLTFPYSVPIAVTAMGLHHFVIGVGEGIVSMAIISILLKVRPDLMEIPKIAPLWMGELRFTTKVG